MEYEEQEEYDGYLSLSELYIIIIILLVFLALIFFFMWLTKSCVSACEDPGYQLKINSDGTVLNLCGENRTSPCFFAMSTLQDATLRCNQLSNICTAFSYNQSTQNMKIINPNNTFFSAFSNVFINNGR